LTNEIRNKQEFIQFLTDEKNKVDSTSTSKVQLMTQELNAARKELVSLHSSLKDQEMTFRIKMDTLCKNEEKSKSELCVAQEEIKALKEEAEKLQKSNEELQLQVCSGDNRVKEKVNQIIER